MSWQSVTFSSCLDPAVGGAGVSGGDGIVMRSPNVLMDGLFAIADDTLF